MTLWFKHLAVRLWLALFIASLTAMLLLPALARSMGPAWMIIPVVIFFLFSFWLVGWVFAAIGRIRWIACWVKPPCGSGRE